MGSSESKSKQTISASDVIKSEDDASSLDDRAIRQAGFIQDVNSDLYNRLGIHAESYVQFPELEDSAFIHDFRDHVMAMARNLQKLINENESMSEKVDAMKKSLRYVDFGIGICRKAQEESARKILAKRKDVKRKKVQVRPSDPQFTKYDKEIQTASMQDVVIEFTTSAIRESSGLDELTTMLQKGTKI